MGTRRRSKQQELIYQYLCTTAEHPTAERIFQALRPKLPSLSLGTVYRNLSRFCEEGLVKRLPFSVERFDHDTTPHAHFCCRLCGRVMDLPGLEGQPEAEQAACLQGHRVERCEILCYGICQDCASKEAPPS